MSGLMSGSGRVISGCGGKEESGYVLKCFGVACERVVVGWETKKFKCFDEVLGRKERWTRMTLGPPTRHSPCFVCAAFTSIKTCGVAAHHFTCHCIAMIPAVNAARLTCVPCERNLFLSNAKDTLAAIPHPAPNERMRRLVYVAARDET